MRESQVVNRILSEGVEKGRKMGQLESLRDTLQMLLTDKFGPLPEEVRQRIESSDDVEQLKGAIRQVPRLRSLDKLKI